jgi:hypothetical protein
MSLYKDISHYKNVSKEIRFTLRIIIYPIAHARVKALDLEPESAIISLVTGLCLHYFVGIRHVLPRLHPVAKKLHNAYVHCV